MMGVVRMRAQHMQKQLNLYSTYHQTVPDHCQQHVWNQAADQARQMKN
jgi:hypothetical protein